MHRNSLLSLIVRYQEKHPEESESILRLTTFIKAYIKCFDRTLPIGHLTGSAWLINADQSKVLLTHHRKLNRWLQLGGHADGEPDLLSVALREAFEESGLETIVPIKKEIFDIDIHLIPERKDEAAHHHYDVRFALQSVGSDLFKVSEESHDLSWILIAALEKKTDEVSILRMKEKWLALKTRGESSSVKQ